MESDKRKLREATPEITTSQKYDSNIKILPKYQCKAYCDNTNDMKIHTPYKLGDIVIPSFHLNHNGYHYEHF
jgi:CxxC motif-containing protein